MVIFRFIYFGHIESIQIMALKVVPIHKYPEYFQDCCNLINTEWKRSDTARLHSLHSSCDHLPTSLILLKDNKLIGHLKLSVIPSIKNACFIESVIIDSLLRGKGYGKFLMEKAEEYVKKFLGLDIIYLSTKGQEEFYKKLGYNQCLPISIYGNSVSKVSNQVCCGESKYIPGKGPPPPPLPKSEIPIATKTYMKKDI